MKSYDKILFLIERLAARFQERTRSAKKSRELCKEFSFTAEHLNGVLAEGRTTK